MFPPPTRREKAVFETAAEVLDLEIDLLFFDTTSTYFVTKEAGAPVARDQQGNPVPDGAEGAAGVSPLPRVASAPPTPSSLTSTINDRALMLM